MSYAQTTRLCLSNWITHLLTAIPPRSRATFVESLCVCLIFPEGWVTRAIRAITRGRRWTTYYKLLEHGSVRTLRLAHASFDVVNNALPMETLNLVIDDTPIPCQSETAPGSAIRDDHAKKTNRPQFLQAQCWVTLGVNVLGNGGRKHVLPIVSCLVPLAGNRSKLIIALALVRGARDDEQACPNTIRCLIHEGAPGVATAVAKDAGHRSGAARYHAIHAARRVAQPQTWTTENLSSQNDTRVYPGFAGDRTQAHTVWQGAVDSFAYRGRNGVLSERQAGACGVVRVLRCGQTEMVNSTFAAGNRNRIKC